MPAKAIMIKPFHTMKKAWPLDKKFLGEEHPNIATSYSNLGLAYGDKGEYDKAISYYEKSLGHRPEVSGREEHLNIALIIVIWTSLW
jgi:tetratricopeptide (TPR) repeat protein